MDRVEVEPSTREKERACVCVCVCVCDYKRLLLDMRGGVAGGIEKEMIRSRIPKWAVVTTIKYYAFMFT